MLSVNSSQSQFAAQLGSPMGMGRSGLSVVPPSPKAGMHGLMSPQGTQQMFSPTASQQLFSPPSGRQGLLSPSWSPKQLSHSVSQPNGFFSPPQKHQGFQQRMVPHPTNPGPMAAMTRSRTLEDVMGPAHAGGLGHHHPGGGHAHGHHLQQQHAAQQAQTPRARAQSANQPGHAGHGHEPLGLFTQGRGGAGAHVLTHAHSAAVEHKAQPLTPAAAQAVFQIRSLLNLGKRAKGQDQIVHILRGLDSQSLNGVLNAIGIDNLLAGTRDSRVRSKYRTRSALVEMLGTHRVQQLNFDNQVDLVHAIQNHGKKTPQDQNAVRHVFLNNKGANLSKLKTACDMNGSSDLTDLLYKYMEGPPREAIMNHLHSQGATLSKSSPVKILSDVDDTLYSSMFDSSFPKGTVYPGVLELYHSLDVGPSEDETKEGNIVFLTARPGFLQNSTFDKIKSLGVKKAAVLMGALSHIIGNDVIASKKYENYHRFKQLYPEFRYVWFGDTSQGDMLLGEDMLGDSDGKHCVAGVFIHDMVDRSGGYKTSPHERAAMASRGVIVFDSYVTPATECYKRGLISAAALQRVMESAQGEMSKIAWSSGEQRQARWNELNAALKQANAALQSGGAGSTLGRSNSNSNLLARSNSSSNLLFSPTPSNRPPAHTSVPTSGFMSPTHATPSFLSPRRSSSFRFPT